VIISHRNVVANIIQISAFEKEFRQSYKTPGQETTSEVGLGLLPLNHIYALVVTHYAVYNGDKIIILPKFEIGLFLSTIQKYKIQNLYVVSLCLGEHARAATLTAIRYLRLLLQCCGAKRFVTNMTSVASGQL
jgi:hypothetical protein